MLLNCPPASYYCGHKKLLLLAEVIGLAAVDGELLHLRLKIR